MTARRWRIIGGFVMGAIFIVAVNGIQSNPLSWQGIAVAVAAGVIGIRVGEWVVREWQEAGEED